MQRTEFASTILPKVVKKRDGTTEQSFDIAKIENAVRKAWVGAEGTVDEPAIRRVAMRAASAFEALDEASVEDIQDAVETALMQNKRFAVAKAYILYRQKRTEARQARRALDPSAISDYIHASKYARYEPSLLRREVYDETVARVEMMHQRKFADISGMRGEISWAFDLVRQKRLLPSMRSMQFSGPAIEVNNARLFNCSFTLVDRVEAFSEALFLLLCGCGVGYSVQFEHVDQLSRLGFADQKNVRHHVIQDTIEGWADALAALIRGYLDGVYVEFSYHLIRPAGAPLKTSGGKAPGHVKLKESLEAIRQVLHGAQGRKLRPIECHRIMCHAAGAVLSGGIRRCLPIGTLVHLTRGLVTIENVKTGDTVRTATGWSKVTDVIEQGVQSITEIQTQIGPFQCTNNHRMAVFTSPSTYTWKEAGKLEPGDRLVFVDHVIEGCQTKLPSWSYERLSKDHTSIDITIPELDENIAWFIGYLHGNGYVHVNRNSDEGGSNVVSFSMNEQDAETPERIRRLRAVLTRFGVKCSDTKLDDEETRRVSASGKQLALYFENFKCPKVPLKIPSFILEGNPTIKSSYLAGLFDSDGGAKNRPVLLVASIYPNFIKEVQNVYASLGIITRIKLNRPKQGKWQPLWHLSLVGELPRKVFDKCIVPFSVKTVPIRTGTQFDYGYPRKFILESDLNYSQKWAPTSEQMTVGTFERCGGNRRGLMPVAVIKVTNNVSEAETYDLSVQDNHEFVANGLLVHNSAMISLFSPDDGEMMVCKTGDWWQGDREPYFAYANNSVAIIEGDVKEVQFKRVLQATKEFGDPGFVFLKQRHYGVNPCCEISMNPRLVIDDSIIQWARRDRRTSTWQGRNVVAEIERLAGQTVTGWSFCNLCEINAAKLTSFEDFMEVAKAATLIGTLQASYTNFPYLGWVSEAIADRDALLGIGMTGMLDAPHIAGNPEYQRAIAGHIKIWNENYANRIGIKRAARTTCVKPSGTTSLELGCVGSGIHPHHARRYIRRVTADEYETVFQAFQVENPHMCVKKPDGKWVIEFPVQAPDGAILKKDVRAIEFLEMVRSTQENWVLPGTADDSASPGLNHNVSNTVNVAEHEWDTVADYLWQNRASFTGVSLLPEDPVLPFMPFEAIVNESQERRWNELVANYKPIDYASIVETEDGTDLAGEVACAGGACLR